MLLRLRLCVGLLLGLLLGVVHVVPTIVIVVGVPLCYCVVIVIVIVLSLSNVADCYSAVFGIVSCSSPPVAGVGHVLSFALSFSIILSSTVSFVTFAAFSKKVAITNWIVVVVPFSSTLPLSFGIVVPVAVVSSVDFSFVLSFAFFFLLFFPFPLILHQCPWVLVHQRVC